MASSSRHGSRLIVNLLSKDLRPAYVCRSCRTQVTFHPEQRRHLASSGLPRLKHRDLNYRKSLESNVSSRSPQDYIQPKAKEDKAVQWEDIEDEEFYEEANSWEGLDVVGHEGHWKDIPARDIDAFSPFANPNVPAEIDRNFFAGWLYAAVIDVFVNKSLGKYPEIYDNAVRKAAASQGFDVTDNGAIRGFKSLDKNLSSLLENSTSEFDATAEGNAQDHLEDAQALFSQAKLDFKDPATFEILKRFAQISGQRIPDPIISNVWNKNRTLNDLVNQLTNHFVRAQKSSTAKTIQAIQQKAFLSQEAAAAGVPQRKTLEPLGPNVAVFSRRETSVDREKEVGRWKVIVQELEKRGLPPLGHKPAALRTGDS